MLATIIIAALVFAVLGGIISYLIKHRKDGCGSCGNQCSGCSASTLCHSQQTNADRNTAVQSAQKQ